MKKILITLLIMIIVCIVITFIGNDTKVTSEIPLEYEDYTFETDELDKVSSYSGNIIFTEKKVQNQIIILKDYDEYKEYMENYADQMAINGKDRFDKELQNAKWEFDEGKVAIVIYDEKLESYGSKLYVQNNILYVERESKEKYPLSVYYDEDELDEYKSVADIYFLEKDIINSLTKVVIIDKQ